MSHIILQPAGGKTAKPHYKHTIETPVDISSITEVLDKETLERINAIYPSGQAYVWGIKNGNKNRNLSSWNKVRPGDFIFFSGNKKIFSIGVVTWKLKSKELAERLWGIDDSDAETWENIYFVDEVRKMELDYTKFNEIAGYEQTYIVQGFQVMNEQKSERVINWLQLYSDYYVNEVSKKDFEKEVDRLMKGSLDTAVNGTSRKEQGYLRKQLFKDKKVERCSICGEELPVDMLVTAHIKKRSLCTKEERLDVENIVLPMCKLGCDDLYEKGYILVECGIVGINRSKKLTPRLEAYLDNIKGARCFGWKVEMEKYFEYHNNSVSQ